MDRGVDKKDDEKDALPVYPYVPPEVDKQIDEQMKTLQQILIPVPRTQAAGRDPSTLIPLCSKLSECVLAHTRLQLVAVSRCFGQLALWPTLVQ